MPERYRTAIVLCDLQGLTHEEVARRLGRPVGTVSARLSRARERLRGRLGRRGLALPSGVLAAALGAKGASAMPAALTASTIKVAMTVSAGITTGTVPASIATLSEGVLRSMLWTRLTMISVAVFVAGTAATGVAVLAQHHRLAPRVEAPAPKPTGPAAETVAKEEPPREAELIVRSAANLRRIAAGMHAYADSNTNLPPSAIFGANGKPLLSWRVAILPYLGDEEKALYKQFQLDEPWDGPHNKALLAKMPKIYAPIVTPARQPHATYYQGFVGKGAFFEGTRGFRYPDITDGTVNTLMVVEAETPVPWTKPEDLRFAPGEALPKLGGQFKDGFVSVTADGYTRFIKRSIDPKTLKFLITRNDGEIINSAEIGEGITP